MNYTRIAVLASSCAAAAALGIAAVMSPSLSRPAGAQAAAPPPDRVQLKALYTEKCSACHDLGGRYDPAINGYSRQEWRRTVMRMMRKKDSNISDADAADITRYLVSLAPREDRRNQRPVDPWATDSQDVWTTAPTETRVFNFEEAALLSELTPVSAGAPGPAAAWHTVAGVPPDGTVMKEASVKSNPSHFALLMDRHDEGRNLDVRVRFKIEAGTASPAVGIVFGFANSKTYDVLRFDAKTNTLSLIKIAEPVHTTLQETAVVQPSIPAAATAANALPVYPHEGPHDAGKAVDPGWHTLRLLVNNGDVRGWIDMEKRVSTQDSAYAGGKVGLWTQGDTVALFDDWTIDLYDPPAAAPPTAAQ